MHLLTEDDESRLGSDRNPLEILPSFPTHYTTRTTLTSMYLTYLTLSYDTSFDPCILAPRSLQ